MGTIPFPVPQAQAYEKKLRISDSLKQRLVFFEMRFVQTEGLNRSTDALADILISFLEESRNKLLNLETDDKLDYLVDYIDMYSAFISVFREEDGKKPGIIKAFLEVAESFRDAISQNHVEISSFSNREQLVRKIDRVIYHLKSILSES